MVSIRWAAATAFAVAFWRGATAEEIDTIKLVSPAKHAAYLSTSDVVIVGSSISIGSPGTIKILAEEGTGGPANARFQCWARRENDNWAWHVTPSEQRGWRPGAYCVQITIKGRRAEVPITFIADQTGTGVPIPFPTTAINTDEYQKLPAVKLGMATLSDSSKDLPDILESTKPFDREIIVDGEDEFAVVGDLRFKNAGDAFPFGLILRLTDARADGGINDKDVVTVGESITRLEPADDRGLFRYRTVVRAPNRPGKLTLEASYRRQVVAASSIEVRRAAVDGTGNGWVVEYPEMNTIYAPTSEIVVAGRGRPVSIEVAVKLNDQDDVRQQSCSVTTGGHVEDGAWSIRLPLPGQSVWPPGEYWVDVCPAFGRRISFPISVIADAAVPAPPLAIQTTIGSEDYAALPCLNLAGVILSTPDSALPNVSARKKDDSPTFRIHAGQEFSCESALTFEDAGDFVPFEVILRLTETTARGGQKPGDPKVTVGEVIATYQLAVQEGLYPFRSVLRAPNQPGKLKFDAIYRKTVIASATIEVVPVARN